MKKLLPLSVLLAVCWIRVVLAAGAPTMGPTDFKTGQPPPVQAPPKSLKAPPKGSKELPNAALRKVEELPATRPVFTFPGLVGIDNGNWAESENLYNLPRGIEVYAEIVKPESLELPFDSAEIARRVKEMFLKARLTPVSTAPLDEPTLPLYHVLIFVDKLDRAMVLYISCRLFEGVDVDRLSLPDNFVFQAITWEKQNMVVAAPADIPRQLDSNLQEMTQGFLQLVTHFNQIKSTQKQDTLMN